MSILNKYKRWKPIMFINDKKTIDFVISQDDSPSIPINGNLTKRCMVSYINFKDEECVSNDGTIESLSGITFENSVNTGVELNDIGLTCMDNGFIKFDREIISKQEFYYLLTDSHLYTDKEDFRLKLKPISGNTKKINYNTEYISEGNDKYMKFNGGFIQGFYKIFGFDYQVLPQYIENAWTLDFVIRKRNYTKESGTTINDIYPENKGIFFYMGTRAENKFSYFYNNEFTEKFEKRDYEKFNAMDMKCSSGETLDYSDIKDLSGNTVNNANEIKTSNGAPCESNKYMEAITDNKHIFFDRTKNGFTTDNWDEGDKVKMTWLEQSYLINLYLFMNRTKNGLTTDTIDEFIDKFNEIDANKYDGELKKIIEYYQNEYKDSYDIISDITDNAFALKINDDGSVGYKYLIKNCDNEDKYSIEEEHTFSDMVKDNEWCHITATFKILNGSIDECGRPIGERKMRIYIYINGYLKLVSKELPEFRFRELNDRFDKQECVPFNLSLGGGTQGLMEMIWLNYNCMFDRVFPLEKYFSGTFIGDIRSFRFYNCQLQFNEIKNNFLYENI